MVVRGGFNHKAPLMGEVILVMKGIGLVIGHGNGIGLRTGEELMNVHMVSRGEMIMVCWIGMVTRREVSKKEIGVGIGLLRIMVGGFTGPVLTKKQREKIGKNVPF